jgi:hypothetical protein
MFQLLTMTEAHVASVTNRVEKHGEDDKPAVSLGLELTLANTALDLFDPKIREALYKAAEGQADLPGVEQSTPVLRCNSFERHTLPVSYEGWTLEVDDGVDDTTPMAFGGVKADKFSVEAKQGGSVVVRLRAGTCDVDAAKLGKLAMHNGQSIWITLTAPKPGEEPAGDAKPKGKQPDATDMFAGGDGPGDDDEGDGDGEADAAPGETKAAARETKPGDPDHVNWPFPDKPNNSMEAPPQHLTEPKVSKASRKRAKAGASAH